MGTREKYLKFKKEGKDVFLILENLKKTNSPLNSLVKLREEFPDLSLMEAKEILILSETSYQSLEDYQNNIINEIKNEI